MEQSFHLPRAAAELAALRSARSFARACGSSGSAGWGAEFFLCVMKRKSSAPHGAELPSAAGGSRACRTPECAKLCSRLWQLRLCRMRCGVVLLRKSLVLIRPKYAEGRSKVDPAVSRRMRGIAYFRSTQIGCGQKPRTSVAMVSTAMQSWLMQGRTMGVTLVASLHHMARMTLK